MAIHLNTTPNPSAIKFNGVDLDKVYFNNVLVWQKSLIIDVPHHYSNIGVKPNPYISISKLITTHRKHGESVITIRVAKGVVIPSMEMDQHLTGGITKIILENRGEIQDSYKGFGLYVHSYTTLVLNNLGAIRGHGGHGGKGGTGHVGNAGAKGTDIAASHKKVVASKVSWGGSTQVRHVNVNSHNTFHFPHWVVVISINAVGMHINTRIRNPCGTGSISCGTGMVHVQMLPIGSTTEVSAGVTLVAGSYTKYKTVTTPKKVGGKGGTGGAGGAGGTGGEGIYYLHPAAIGVGGHGGGGGHNGGLSKPHGGHSGAKGHTGYRGGHGGAGGDWGAKGGHGDRGAGSGDWGAVGGAAGYSIRGINRCTIVVRGTLSGVPINS